MGKLSKEKDIRAYLEKLSIKDLINNHDNRGKKINDSAMDIYNTLLSEILLRYMRNWNRYYIENIYKIPRLQSLNYTSVISITNTYKKIHRAPDSSSKNKQTELKRFYDNITIKAKDYEFTICVNASECYYFAGDFIKTRGSEYCDDVFSSGGVENLKGRCWAMINSYSYNIQYSSSMKIDKDIVYIGLSILIVKDIIKIYNRKKPNILGEDDYKFINTLDKKDVYKVYCDLTDCNYGVRLGRKRIISEQHRYKDIKDIIKNSVYREIMIYFAGTQMVYNSCHHGFSFAVYIIPDFQKNRIYSNLLMRHCGDTLNNFDFSKVSFTVFKSHMFNLVYMLLCYNYYFGVIHNDMHLNNTTFETMKKADLSATFEIKNYTWKSIDYIVEDKKYTVPFNGDSLSIIDFGNSMIDNDKLEDENKLIIKSFYKNEFNIDIKVNLKKHYPIFTAVDMYVFSKQFLKYIESKPNEKMKSLMVKINKITKNMLLNYDIGYYLPNCYLLSLFGFEVKSFDGKSDTIYELKRKMKYGFFENSLPYFNGVFYKKDKEIYHYKHRMPSVKIMNNIKQSLKSLSLV